MDLEHQRSGGWEPHSDQGHLACAPQAKGRLGPRNPGCIRYSVPGAAHRIYLPPRASRRPGSPTPSHTSLTHGNSGLGHATLTKATPTPCPQVTSLTQVHTSSVTRPSLAPPSNPHTRRGGGRDVKKEGQKPSFLRAFLPGLLNQSSNLNESSDPEQGCKGRWAVQRKNEGIQEGPGFPGGR